MPTEPWTDNTLMPWGVHKGKKLSELPASYLLWLYEQTWIKDWPGLHAYLKKNEDLLMDERRDGSHPDDDEDLRSYEDYKNHR